MSDEKDKPQEHHDFRDTGNPLEKRYPEPDWRNWEKRNDEVPLPKL